MRTARRRFEELAWALGAHGVAIRLHRMLGHRVDSRSLTQFYSQLLPPKSLVFDIGANTGIYSEALEATGARVVAVEPNGDCLRHIELTYRNRHIETLHTAIGPENGLVAFNVSDARDDASSIVDHNSEVAWSRTANIPVLTLDSLIKHFGVPDYIKIDVEGYESAVLRGLSNLPPLLSFEFHHLYAEAAVECFDSPLFDIRCEFNVTDATGARFALADWVGLDEIRKVGRKIIDDQTYRDIYVRVDA